MNKLSNANKRVIGILIIIALLVVGLVFKIAIRQLTLKKLPVYTFSQELSTEKNFAISFLKHNDIVYMSDYYEWTLQVSDKVGKEIGKTIDGGYLYKIKGQDNGEYIFYSDGVLMPNTWIFRRKDVQPRDISNMTVLKITLGEKSNKFAESDDWALINEIQSDMKQNKTVDLDLPKESLRYIALNFNAIELQGMVYRADILVTPDRHVYIGDFLIDLNNIKAVPAGKLLTDWVLNALDSEG